MLVAGGVLGPIAALLVQFYSEIDLYKKYRGGLLAASGFFLPESISEKN
jgi:hypothetical protein